MDRAKHRIHWIVGGLPKEDGLGPCEQHLGNIAAAYTIGDAGPRFAELLEAHVHVERAEMLQEALHWPGRSVTQRTNGMTFDLRCDFQQ